MSHKYVKAFTIKKHNNNYYDKINEQYLKKKKCKHGTKYMRILQIGKDHTGQSHYKKGDTKTALFIIN